MFPYTILIYVNLKQDMTKCHPSTFSRMNIFSPKCPSIFVLLLVIAIRYRITFPCKGTPGPGGSREVCSRSQASSWHPGTGRWPGIRAAAARGRQSSPWLRLSSAGILPRLPPDQHSSALEHRSAPRSPLLRMRPITCLSRVQCAPTPTPPPARHGIRGDGGPLRLPSELLRLASSPR